VCVVGFCVCGWVVFLGCVFVVCGGWCVKIYMVLGVQGNNEHNNCSSERCITVVYCKFDVCRRCCYPDSGCSFLNEYGMVVPCRYLPNPFGYFTARKRVGVGSANPVVLSPSKFVNRRVV